MCVYFMMGTPEGSTESGFMEKPGIEPATPGLQDIGLSPTPRRLHYFIFIGYFKMGAGEGVQASPRQPLDPPLFQVIFT